MTDHLDHVTTAQTVTDVFYDQGRGAWVVQFDDRHDRQEHFATVEAATKRASDLGWKPDPPAPGEGRAEPTRPALHRLQTEDRGTYGQHEVLVSAAALAIVEAIDVLAVTVRQMAAVLDGMTE